MNDAYDLIPSNANIRHYVANEQLRRIAHEIDGIAGARGELSCFDLAIIAKTAISRFYAGPDWWIVQEAQDTWELILRKSNYVIGTGQTCIFFACVNYDDGAVTYDWPDPRRY